jgi:hypothetical protein
MIKSFHLSCIQTGITFPLQLHIIPNQVDMRTRIITCRG